MKKILALIVALCFAMAGLVSTAAPASAHVGDLHVTNATCVDSDTMTATYRVGWTNGTATGKLYQRSGLHGQTGNAGGSTAGWTFVKNVSGSSGNTTFTVNHEKSAFSGGNGPWWSSKVVFSDGYGVAADTRVEGFDWNKCTPPTNYDWKYQVTCTGVSGTNPNGPIDSVDSNVRIKNLKTGEVRTFNYHPNTSGPASFSWSYTAQYGMPATWDYYEVQWVQVNGTNYHWQGSLVCGTPPPTDECVDLPGNQPEGFQCAPLTENDEKITHEQSCEAGTVTKFFWERSRTQVFDAQTQTWSYPDWPEWTKVDTKVRDMTDDEYDTYCKPPQPPTDEREVPQSNESCDLKGVGGVETWNDVYTTTYTWNSETRKWVGTETGPVAEDYKFTPYTDDEYKENCAPPAPEPEPRADEAKGCDLTAFGDFEPGVIVRDGTEAFVWNSDTREWELSGVVDWNEWTQEQVYSNQELLDLGCVDLPEQPEPVVEEASSTDYQCGDAFQTVTTTTTTTDWYFDVETFEWVLAEPVTTESVEQVAVDVVPCDDKPDKPEEPKNPDEPKQPQEPKTPTTVLPNTGAEESTNGLLGLGLVLLLVGGGLLVVRKRA